MSKTEAVEVQQEINSAGIEKENWPYVEGQLLIYQYSKSKAPRKRVVKVLKVRERGAGSHKYYEYDLQYTDGTVLYKQSGNGFCCFAAYRQRIQRRIQITTQTLNNQEEQYKASLKLEADARQLFTR